MQNERRKWKSAALVAALAVALLALAPPARAETYWSAKDGMPWPWNPGWPALWLSNSPSGEHHLLLDNDQAVVATAQGLLSGAIAMESLQEDPPTPPGGGGGGGEPEPEPYTNALVQVIGMMCYSNLTPVTWGLRDGSGRDQSWPNWTVPSPPIDPNGGTMHVLWENPDPALMSSQEWTGFCIVDITKEFDGQTVTLRTNDVQTVTFPPEVAVSPYFGLSFQFTPTTFTFVFAWTNEQGQVATAYSNHVFHAPDLTGKLDTNLFLYWATNRFAFTNETQYWQHTAVLWAYPYFKVETNQNSEVKTNWHFITHVLNPVGHWMARKGYVTQELERGIKELYGNQFDSPFGGLGGGGFGRGYYIPRERQRRWTGEDFLREFGTDGDRPVEVPPSQLYNPPRERYNGVPSYEIIVITNVPPGGMWVTCELVPYGWQYEGTNVWTYP